MEKRMRLMLITMAILFGGIFLWKMISGLLLSHYTKENVPIATVSAMTVQTSAWQSTLTATGSLRAIKGVNVTTELAGMVKKIYFTPGMLTKENTLLVELNADTEIGQLQSLKAQTKLAQITYERDLAQYQIRAVSKQTLDTDYQNLQSLQGQVREQEATVQKKMIRAPFDGKLGINNVNPGQYINTGDNIVTLQQLNPIYIDFYIPQQSIIDLALKQTVTITCDAYPHKTFKGTITTINPLVETSTRNVQVEATVLNPTHELMPGMFANVTITTHAPRFYLTVPQTAIRFNPYGNVVYVIQNRAKKGEKPELRVKQLFVTTGATRGEQITILKGLKSGDRIVTSGLLKLKNDSLVTINNAIAPPNRAIVTASNEHG